MSGRLYAPPALDGLNLLTDPEAVKWEIRYVRYFVSEFKDSPLIVAWDLGNECECMSPVSSSSEAWMWVAAITNGIKVVDNSRPVISGTGTRISSHNEWNIKDLGENVDVLTTHFLSHFYTFYRKGANEYDQVGFVSCSGKSGSRKISVESLVLLKKWEL